MPPGVEPPGLLGRNLSYRGPGKGAPTDPTVRTGSSRGWLTRGPPVIRGRAAARARCRRRAFFASASGSLVRSLCCSSRSQRCSSPLVWATRASSAIVMPGVLRSRTVARAARWTPSKKRPLRAPSPLMNPHMGVEAAEALGERQLVSVVPLDHKLRVWTRVGNEACEVNFRSPPGTIGPCVSRKSLYFRGGTACTGL